MGMEKSNRTYMDNIDFDYEKLAEICDLWGILRIDLYGSVLDDRFHDKSDIDIIVEFDSDVPRGGFRVAAASDLGDFWGRKVDMHTFEEIGKFQNRKTADAILRNGETIYEA